MKSYIGMEAGLNPYFDGSISVRARRNAISKSRYCLNPYFDGSISVRTS